jgi:hypothetical protein
MTVDVTYDDRQMIVNLTDPFESLQTFQNISTLSPPVGTFDRLILDFSEVHRFEPAELFQLFIELEASPQFEPVNILLVNLTKMKGDKGNNGFTVPENAFAEVKEDHE